MSKAIDEMRIDARILGAIESDIRHGMSDNEIREDILSAYPFLSEEDVDKYIGEAEEELAQV